VGRIYSSLLRPPLFALPAESAHRLANATLGLPLPWEAIGATPVNPALEVEIAGLKLRNPVGLAAGFDKDCRHLASLGRLGFGYVVGGTVTLEPRPGNALPRVGRYPARRSLVNAMGFPNGGARAARTRLDRLSRSTTTLVSISGSSAAEVIAAFEVLEPAAEGIEFNVSCPNVRWGRDVDTEALVQETLPRLKRMTAKPIFIKLPPYREPREREAILALVKLAAEAGADAITASNTHPIKAPEMSIGTGGLSGRDIFPDTVRIVADIFRETGGRIPINACGGIFDGQDALDCIQAGATTIQVYTGFVYEGPRIVRNIATRLLQAVTGKMSLGDLVGAARADDRPHGINDPLVAGAPADPA
jgi:dihydroorotate dehydrogenase subfamily 2